ncbi:MAG: chorismate mutase related enzyme [Mucilaginibacter sp.]|nr:chorismate mutase related enzyme [Mucilaginibacter sp.]
MEQLLNFRERIDEIDEKIVKLINQRLEICKSVAKYKSENDIPMMQPGRVQEVLLKRRKLADQLSINPDLVENVYKLIVEEACVLEDEIINGLVKKD